MLTKKELGKKLNVSQRTIDRYRDKGMPCITMPGGTIRFELKEVMKWLKNITG